MVLFEVLDQNYFSPFSVRLSLCSYSNFTDHEWTSFFYKYLLLSLGMVDFSQFLYRDKLNEKYGVWHSCVLLKLKPCFFLGACYNTWRMFTCLLDASYYV